MSRTCLQNLVDHIDQLLKLADQIEDRYRRDGLSWHTSQQAAREYYEPIASLSPGLFCLEGAFELISNPQQYQNLFAPLTNILQRLLALRSDAQHVPSAATAQHLLHTVNFEMLPAMDALANEFKTVQQPFSQIHADANTLVNISRQSFEADNNGVRIAWHDFVGADPADRTLRSRTGEWRGFRTWVRVLPETQRALQNGGREHEAHLDDIALDLLWVEGDEFED